jgi:hypothetical protein
MTAAAVVYILELALGLLALSGTIAVIYLYRRYRTEIVQAERLRLEMKRIKSSQDRDFLQKHPTDRQKSENTQVAAVL